MVLILLRPATAILPPASAAWSQAIDSGLFYPAALPSILKYLSDTANWRAILLNQVEVQGVGDMKEWARHMVPWNVHISIFSLQKKKASRHPKYLPGTYQR